MTQSIQESRPASAQLGLWDVVSIIVGIVVGTSIFKTPQLVFGNVTGAWQGLGLWGLGGVLSFFGALCYAELATTYPRSGGDYVYLTRAYGSCVGFLFGWAQLAVILTGSIAAMAYAFVDYAVPFWALNSEYGVWLAAGSVVVLSIMNLLGVVVGKATQNLLTVAKVLGLVGIVAAGLLWGGSQSLEVKNEMSGPGFGLAMVFVLYAYGGWNDAAFIAAEIRDVRRNLPRALLLGTTGITIVYLLVNGAYLWGLGFEGVRASSAPAADVGRMAFGDWGGKAMSLLVMISALGALNGLIFTGSRIFSSVGRDHSVFALLGNWHSRFGVPVWSLVVQAAIALTLIVSVGTDGGRDAIDQMLITIGTSPLPWSKYFGGFNTLVAGTAPVFWFFFLLTGIALFVLRIKDREIERPFSIRFPLFPIVPIIFCLTCVYMLYSSIDYARLLSLVGIAPLAIGVPLYLLSRPTNSK